MITVYDKMYRGYRILITSDWNSRTSYSTMVFDSDKTLLSSAVQYDALQTAINEATSKIEEIVAEEEATYYDSSETSIDDISVSECHTEIEIINIETSNFRVRLISRYDSQIAADMVVQLSRDKTYITYSGSFLSKRIVDEMDSYETERNIRWDIQDFLERRAYGEDE